jgi:hypothetical protein
MTHGEQRVRRQATIRYVDMETVLAARPLVLDIRECVCTVFSSTFRGKYYSFRYGLFHVLRLSFHFFYNEYIIY